MKNEHYLSETPLTDADLETAVGALFGTGTDTQDLTPEQRAEQDARLAPFMEAASGRYSAARDAAGRARSESARVARLKVLARKAARAEAQS